MFEFIDANQATFDVAVMCRVLGVSTSGYYGWRGRPPSPRALADEVMVERIRAVHVQSRQTYGYRRVTAELVDGQGEPVGKHRVARLMRRAGIQGRYPNGSPVVGGAGGRGGRGGVRAPEGRGSTNSQL